MLSDFYLYVMILGFSAVIFWLLPPENPRVKIIFLTVVSVLFVTAVAPGGALAVAYLALVAYGARWIERVKSRVTLLLTIALALAPLVGTRVLGDFDTLYTFGIAFATVKAIGLVIDNYARPRPYTLLQIVFFLFFFPLFTIGPVERIEKFATDSVPAKFDISQFVDGMGRVIIGVFTVHYVCDTLILGALAGERFSLDDQFQNMSVLTTWWFVAFKFFYTYLNFVGFSEIAIGSASLFGMKVIENFDRPIFATNIQEFWRRYHISMGNWITRYLFFPIVGLIKKQWSNYVATLFAFITFGAWHAFTPNYLYWGVMHGLALAGYHVYRRHLLPKQADNPVFVVRLQKTLGAIITIAFVAYLQTFANLPSFAHGIDLTYSLLGLL